MADRINWPRIKDMLGVDYSTPFLFILPNSGRQLLHAISHRLEFEATFREDGYDFSDYDELQAIVAETETGLMNGVNMNQLIAILQQMVAAIEQIRVSINNTVNCCDNPQTVPTEDNGVVVGEGEVPEAWGDEITETWADYKAYICGAAGAWVDGMVDVITRFSEALDNGLLVAAGIAGMLALMAITGILVPIEFGLAFGLFSTLVALLTSEPLDDLILYLQENKARLSNVIYCSETSIEAATSIRVMLESELTTTQWNLVRYFDIDSSMAVIFAGQNSAGETLSVEPSASCSCDPVIEASYGWSKDEGTDTVVTIPEGLTYNGLGWLGGFTWSCVEASNSLSFAATHQHTDYLAWYVKTTNDHQSGTELSAVLNVPSGTELVVLVASMDASTEYFGYLEIPLNASFRNVTSEPGAKILSFIFQAGNA